MRILLTGGCGFIGSAFVRMALARGYSVTNLDKLTYAGNPANVAEVADLPGYRFVHADIADPEAVEGALEGVDVVVNMAAESHVDRSILDPTAFPLTDVVGTAVLLGSLPARRRRALRAGLDRRGLRVDSRRERFARPIRSRRRAPTRPARRAGTCRRWPGTAPTAWTSSSHAVRTPTARASTPRS